jgi:type I restriction enzyme, S subunit
MLDSWPQTVLGDLAAVEIGRTPSRKEKKYWTTDLDRPFCTIADMDGRIVIPNREGVTKLAEDEGKAKRFPAGALMMSFKLSIGRTGIAGTDLFPNEAIAWLKPTSDEILTEFLRIYLPTHDYTAAVGPAVKGNTLNKDSIKGLVIPVPPVEVQQRLTHLVSVVEDHAEALRSQVGNAELLRNSVLRDVLSGELALPEAYDQFLVTDEKALEQEPDVVSA